MFWINLSFLVMHILISKLRQDNNNKKKPACPGSTKKVVPVINHDICIFSWQHAEPSFSLMFYSPTQRRINGHVSKLVYFVRYIFFINVKFLIFSYIIYNAHKYYI